MPIQGLPFTDEQLFDSLNVVLPAWILLAVAPRWRFTPVVAAAVALYCSALYAALVGSNMVQQGGMDFGDMFNLQGITKLLGTPGVALPAWVHFVAFDLWVGRWIVQDAVSLGVWQLLLIPVLFATLMLGPLGLLLYWLLRGLFNPAAAAAAGKGPKAKNM